MDITTIRINEEEFVSAMKKIFSPDYQNAAALCVLNMCNDLQNYKPLLFKLAAGVQIDYKYKVDEEVLCDIYALDTWRWNKDIMRENGMIKQGDQIVVTIIAVRPYTPEPYTVSYNCIPENETTLIKTTTCNVEDIRILGYAEHFPGD
jgi:hypothetical protein